MNDLEDAPDELVVRRYVLGLGVLLLTVLLANVFGFLEHPEKVFDVVRNTPLENRLHLIGFVGQIVTGCWLGVSLVFDIRPGRRVAALAWLASVALFFVPMPSAREDGWLAPIICAGVAGVAWISRALHEALFGHEDHART